MVNIFRRPSLKAVVQRQLDECEMDLLRAKEVAEVALSHVDLYEVRRERLREFLRESDSAGPESERLAHGLFAPGAWNPSESDLPDRMQEAEAEVLSAAESLRQGRAARRPV
jgi:hypothetical protein